VPPSRELLRLPAHAPLLGGRTLALRPDLSSPGDVMKQRNLRSKNPGGPSERIAFVQSCWHRDIVDQARTAFLETIKQYGITRARVDCFEVPGAFEIPLYAKLLAKSRRYAAVVAAGFVVDGGIYRHEFVASSVIDALMSVQMDTEVPVISVVLTPQRFHEHEQHRSFFAEHFLVKGEEAAHACGDTMVGIKALRELSLLRQMKGNPSYIPKVPAA
jgi:6,7-dimethyl-8-ribityllumazine synthase